MKIAESKITRIRDFEESDAEYLSKLYSDLEELKIADKNFHGMSAERMMEIFSASQAMYVIETKTKKPKFLGVLFVRKFEEFKLKNYENPLQITCIILPAYRGKGYGRESVYAFMAYSFEKDEKTIFMSRARLSNVASIRIMNRYMQSIPRSKNSDHEYVYFASNATIFFSKIGQQRG